MVLKGHCDGKRVVLDEPVPPNIPPQTPVKVMFEHQEREHVLERIAKLAGSDDGLPADYSQQHDHYIKGTPGK
ncbi:MAG: hypothetical protein IH988_03785 [Planctomycetes bacterium]|nr:hypothetical protein [Planctomycetota bacterium]